MKKIILLLTVVSLFAACKNKSSSILDANKNLVLVDTTGLSKSNALTDVAKQNSTTATTTSATQNARTTSHAVYPNTTSTTTTTTTTVPKRDKGMSDAAKGTVIGAGTGAIVGAIVSKDKGKGAIIGALIGGGTGYAVGRGRDRRSGRVARARARRAAGY